MKTFKIIFYVIVAFHIIMSLGVLYLIYEIKIIKYKILNCSGNKQCIAKQFEEFTSKYSAKKSIEIAEYLENENLIKECHFYSHFIGKENLKVYNNNLGKALATCGQGCREGCYHGAMESYIVTNNIEINTKEDIYKICESIKNDEYKYLNCIHGIGHGLVKHDTSKVEKMLSICLTIEEPKIRNECTLGTQMENTNQYMELPPDKLKIQLPNICNTEFLNKNKDLKNQCVKTIGERIMFYYTDLNLNKSKEYCALLKEDSTLCEEGIFEEARFRNISIK